MYCIYLTVYHGNKLPPFYIGYSTVKKVLNGYRGSVCSIAYKEIYLQELEDNPHLFKTFIISRCETKKEALNKTARIVAENILCVNVVVFISQLLIEVICDCYTKFVWQTMWYLFV